MRPLSPPSSEPLTCHILQVIEAERPETELHSLHQMDSIDILKIGRARGRGSGQTTPSSSLLQPPQVNPDELQEIQLFPPLDTQYLSLRQFTPSSIDPSVPFSNPFLGVPTGSTIDPASSTFTARDWLYNLLGFIAKEPERYSYQTGNIGMSFANLDVYGFGSPTDYQKTVGNVWLGIGRVFRFWVGTGKQKVQILKGFDGVLNKGEMLLVLGMYHFRVVQTQLRRF
jgi:hypothetical protein